MCELYYLDHFREAVAEKQAEAEAVNERVDVAEDAMRESKSLMSGAAERLAERIAKISLDTAFVKIDQVSNPAARERLIRYAGELTRAVQNNLDAESDHIAALKEFLEDNIGDD